MKKGMPFLIPKQPQFPAEKLTILFPFEMHLDSAKAERLGA